MPPARAYCSSMRSSPKPSSSSRSRISSLANPAKPSIFPKVAPTGLVTAGSAMRISSKATSAAWISRVRRPAPPREKLGSSWKSIPSRSAKR
jgi:hypothetical protein